MKILRGDCLTIMRDLPDNSVDAIVTDPPYGLKFMGKDWDHGVPGAHYWGEALRVAKPGAHILAFGGTRTYHRLACAIEDAGWELRDSIGVPHESGDWGDCPWVLAWVYGSGFPKSHNLKGDHAGLGTALKPAWEPIVLARKPLVGTVAANVLECGTGAINIDGCRIDADWSSDPNRRGWQGGKRPGAVAFSSGDKEAATSPRCGPDNARGRWPANVIHDGSDEVQRLFPVSKDGIAGKRSDGVGMFNFGGHAEWGGYGGKGSAARFFYCAKASRAERNAGLDHLPQRQKVFNGQSDHSAGCAPGSVEDKYTTRPAPNNHPTVKPVALMRYLCRLVTPPGGVVLDPFAGSGSTGIGAVLEGFDFIGIEMDDDYAAIAEARIQHHEQSRSLTTQREQPALQALAKELP